MIFNKVVQEYERAFPDGEPHCFTTLLLFGHLVYIETLGLTSVDVIPKFQSDLVLWQNCTGIC